MLKQTGKVNIKSYRQGSRPKIVAMAVSITGIIPNLTSLYCGFSCAHSPAPKFISKLNKKNPIFNNNTSQANDTHISTMIVAMVIPVAA